MHIEKKSVPKQKGTIFLRSVRVVPLCHLGAKTIPLVALTVIKSHVTMIFLNNDHGVVFSTIVRFLLEWGTGAWDIRKKFFFFQKIIVTVVLW